MGLVLFFNKIRRSRLVKGNCIVLDFIQLYLMAWVFFVFNA